MTALLTHLANIALAIIFLCALGGLRLRRR